MTQLILGNAPIPITDPISRGKRPEFGARQSDPLEGTMSDAWVDYMSRLVQTVQQSSTRIASTSALDQQFDISPNDVSNGVLKEGLYRITYYARITQAAGVSSSLEVSVSWNDGGVAQLQTGAAIVGNTPDTVQSATYLIHIDSASPVRYSTSYVSVGVPNMEYRIDVVLEVSQA